MQGRVEEAYEVLGGARRGVLLTCEHADPSLPEPWQWPAADGRLRGMHWASDLGAAELTRELSAAWDAPAVLARFSRLLVDPNRPIGAEDMFRELADGEPVHLNANIDDAERQERIERCYEPFHAAIDEAVETCEPSLMLAVHSFAPEYEGVRREVEVAMLFDHEEALATEACKALGVAGFVAALNTPYSGRLGMMYSVDSHALPQGRPALEVEVRQDLCVQPDVRRRVAEALSVVRSRA